MEKKQEIKDFIIGGCDTIITEKHGVESKLNFFGDRRNGTGQRKLSINLSLKLLRKVLSKMLRGKESFTKEMECK